MTPKLDTVAICDFCGRSEDEVARLISTPRKQPVGNGVDAHICDECVRACAEMLEEMAREEPKAVADTCQYCGAKARAWQGSIAWCLSPACNQRHKWDTCEPRLVPWIAPTPLQCALGRVAYLALRAIAAAVPARWLVADPGLQTPRLVTLRGRFTAWVYGWAYFWGERAEGRI